MIVEKANFLDILEGLRDTAKAAVDTETTGLEPYKASRLFSIIITTEKQTYYFNFNDVPDHLDVMENFLPRAWAALVVHTIQTFHKIFFANAKFDMAMLDHVTPTTWDMEIHDVLVMARLLRNDHLTYGLDAVAKRLGFEKSDAVEAYIKEHALWAWIKIPGKKTRVKDKFYNRVPLSVMAPYAEIDGDITYKIGCIQEVQLQGYFEPQRETPYLPDEMEKQVTKVLYRMEAEGIHLDERLCIERADKHTEIFEGIARRFHDQSRSVLIDSTKVLGALFLASGHTPPKTKKDNDSIPDEWLERINTPLGNMVREFRTNTKLANGFYRNYLWHLAPDKKVHANINQSGTSTGRLSYSNPNLQQAPDSEVRQVFRPPPGFCLVSIDWDQQEYKMMLDYAEQMDLIQEIKNGHDVHTATATLTGVQRREAKTLNFMLLYGGGVVKLAGSLLPVTAPEPLLWIIWKQENGWKIDTEDKHWIEHVTEEMRAENLPLLLQAEALRNTYFEKLPKVQELIKLCKDTAQDRGYIKTWTGRRLYFRKGFHYKAPNGLIQGGASDVAKLAMIKIDNELRRRKSKLLVQVHDEMIFKIHESELHVVPRLREIMETTFPAKHIGLSTSVEHSWKNLFDTIEGYPSEETRNHFQRESLGGLTPP